MSQQQLASMLLNVWEKDDSGAASVIRQDAEVSENAPYPWNPPLRQLNFQLDQKKDVLFTNNFLNY